MWLLSAFVTKDGIQECIELIDEAKDVGEIPVPPKYVTSDFCRSTYWRQRGKLDVPKERFVSFPHCERAADPSLVVGWAGWNHLERAQATAAYYLEVKEQEGWPADRLTPLLLALLGTLPWVLTRCQRAHSHRTCPPYCHRLICPHQ